MVDADVAQWLRSLPVAPEYRPSEAEFADPISFISKIEGQAEQFGICKIVPPLAKATKKTALSNLTKALGHRANLPTRKQQLGRKSEPGSDHQVAHQLAWQKGETYTLDEFETKAKAFARSLLGTCKEVPALGLESLFWRAVEDEAMFIECASDIPGSAFTETVHPNERLDRGRTKEREVNPGWKLANSSWNARHMAHSRGSLLQFMPENIPGITSPLLQVVMLYSWFGWQLEDHELHSLDYLHFGSAKTWYSVPAGAASALEELVRAHGYGLQLDTKEALTLLGEKTTILSPEILASAGIPCCRLVQNAGEFVVTFPRAYHFAFSHGFSCSEAVNFATPAWLKVAKEAAYRRTLMAKSAMLCHEQLLYQLALTYSRRNDMDFRSSRLNLRNRPSETVKGEFVRSIRTNYHLLQKLKRCGETRCILLEAGKDNIGDLPNLGNIDSISLLSFVCESMESIGNTFYSKLGGKTTIQNSQTPLINWGTSSCTACAVRCFSCIVFLQPTAKSFLDAVGGGRESFAGYDRDTVETTAETAEKDAPQPCTLCPVHALQIRSYLQAHGGSRALVVCHPDYELFEQNAKQYAEDLNIEGATGLIFEKARAEDFAIIELASSQRSGDIWVTQLQLDFCTPEENEKDATTGSSDKEQEEEEQEEKAVKPLKEKKCWIVGRWCGRVWRYDQTSSLLGGSRKGPLLLKGKVVDSECLNRAQLLEPLKQNIRKRKRTQASPLWRIQRQSRFGTDGSGKVSISRNIQPDSDFCQNQELPTAALDLRSRSTAGSQVSVKEAKAEACSGSAQNVEQGVQAAGDISPEDSKLSQSGSIWHDVPITCAPSFDHTGALNDVQGTDKDKRGIQQLFSFIQRKKRAARRKCTNAARHFYTSRLKNLTSNGSRASKEEEIKSRDEETSFSSSEDASDDEFVPPSPVHYTRSRVKRKKSGYWHPGKRTKQNEDDEAEDEGSRRTRSGTKHTQSSSSSASSASDEVSETSEEGSFKCDFEGGCTMSFKTRRELWLHKKNVCTVGDCAKQLCSHSYLLQHYRVHLDARPLKCPWKGCRKTFKWSWARTEHIRVHTGERPYACADCGKSYRFVSDFSRHKRTTGHNGSSI